MDENQSEQNETLTDDQRFEDLQEHHVTPPGDPEFPELEFLFEKESSSLVSPLDVKSPLTPELESEKTSTPTDTASITPKWNWGAFAFPLFFGVAHRSYLGLLILLAAIPWVGPIFGLVWSIIFGFYGEKWTLENRDNGYRDEEEFRKIMSGWNRAGLVGFIIGLVLVVLLGLLAIVFFIVFINRIPAGQEHFFNP